MRNFAACSPGIFRTTAEIDPKWSRNLKARCRRGSYCRSFSSASIAVVTTWGTGSLWLGLATALIGALAVALYCERTLRGLVGAIAQIARGDRYAALPEPHPGRRAGRQRGRRGNHAASPDRCRRAGGRPEKPRGGIAAASRQPRFLHPALPLHHRRAHRHLPIRRRGNPHHHRQSRRPQQGHVGARRQCRRGRGRRQPRRGRGRRRGARLAGADRRLLGRSGRRQGRHRPHHRRPRPHRLYRPQPRRRRRAHRRRGQADRGDRLADLAAWRSMPRSKRRAPAPPAAASPSSRPRSRRWRSRPPRRPPTSARRFTTSSMRSTKPSRPFPACRRA